MLRKDRAKIVSIFLFTIALAAALLTDNQAIEKTRAFSSGPEAGHTGAPGELTCATAGCHTGTPNSGPGEFTLEGPGLYEPGETYQITVRHTNSSSSRERWGFQLTALTTLNDRVGELESANGFTQVLEGGPGGNRQYIEHTFIGSFQGQRSIVAWTFNWTAPSEDIGPVILYAAGNQANNDGIASGADQIYTARATIFSGPPEITGASISGKKLFVAGRNFGEGATLLMCQCDDPATDGSKVKKVSNEESDPFGLLRAKKAGKSIERGSTVQLQVRNPDGTLSAVFSFTRPE